MFDIQTIPGEVGNTVDWEKLEHDLAELHIALGGPAQGDFLSSYFEMAVGELGALQQLLWALDARYAALIEEADCHQPPSIVDEVQLLKVGDELVAARNEFLDGFKRFTTCYGHDLAARVQGKDEKRILEAIQSLQDMDAIWSSHRVLQPSDVSDI
jgi:hypothetical protein